MMIRDPQEARLNWGLEWADYLTSQRDFIVGRLEEHLHPDQVALEDQGELGKETVARALAVLRFSFNQDENPKNYDIAYRHLSGLSYVDSRKLGVVGNGVGGYLASR